MPSAPAAMAALKFSFCTATSFSAKETLTWTPRSSPACVAASFTRIQYGSDGVPWVTM